MNRIRRRFPGALRIARRKKHRRPTDELSEEIESEDDDDNENDDADDQADNFSQSESGASSASASPPSDPTKTGSSMYFTRPPPTCSSAFSRAWGNPRISPPPPDRMMLSRTFSWNSGSTRESRSSMVSMTGGRIVSQAALISLVMSSSVGTPFTGAVTMARCDESPTKLNFSFHSRTMKMVTFACG